MKAIDELRKIISMPDQKHWNCTEMRERALEEWLHKWISHQTTSQSVINQKSLPSEVEDYMKEQLFVAMLDQIMEESAIITKEKNKITGELICLRRNPKA